MFLPRSSSVRRGVLTARLSGLDGVFPLGLAGDDVGVEIEEDGLAGAVVGLVDGGEIELPPMRERQVR